MKCNQCGLDKDINDYYTEEKTNKDGIIYTYINPKCKQCVKDNINKWRKDNPEQTKEQVKKYRQKESFHVSCKATHERSKEREKLWRKNNKDKLKEYNENKMHKKHNINKEELDNLYIFADYSCMYCGISESDSMIKYGERLHKDHAINNGSNGIDNCILACKGCNSWKHTRDWDEWYTPDKSIYTQERFDKIKLWINKIYKKQRKKLLTKSNKKVNINIQEEDIIS